MIENMNAHPSYEFLINYAVGDSLDEENHITLCPQCGATVARFRKVRALYRADDSVKVPTATLARAFSLYHPRRSVSPVPSPFRFKYSFAMIALAILFFCAGTVFAQNSPFSISIIIGPKDQDIQAPVTVVIGVPLHTPLTTPVQPFFAPETTATVLPSRAPLLIVTPVPPQPTSALNQVPAQPQAPQLPAATAQPTLVPVLPTAVPQPTMAPTVVPPPVSGSEVLPTQVPGGSSDHGSSTGSQPPSDPPSQPPSAPPPSQPPSAPPPSQPPSAPPPSQPPSAPPPSQPPSAPPPSAPPPSQPPVPPKPPPNVWLSGPIKNP